MQWIKRRLPAACDTCLAHPAAPAQAYKGPKRDILVDIGTGDSNLDGQLRPESLEQAVKGNSQLHLDIRMQVCQLCAAVHRC